MEIARAREILDPEHREAYESLEPVNEACRMGAEALRRRVPESPYPDGDAGVLACPSCGSCFTPICWRGASPPGRSMTGRPGWTWT